MHRIISGSFSSSIKGPVFVSLIGAVPYTFPSSIAAPFLTLVVGPRRYSDVHRGYDDTDRPAVDKMVISTDSNILHDDFRRGAGSWVSPTSFAR